MQRWMVALVGTAVLAGCGVPSTVRSVSTDKRVKASEEAPMFPATPGYTWQYKVVAHPTDDPETDYEGTETLKIDSVRRDGGATVLSMQLSDSFTDHPRFPVVTMTSDKVLLQGIEYLGPMAEAAEGHTIDFLRFPLKVAAKWDDGLWLGEVKAKETVTVGAGTYQAWKVSVIGTYNHAYTAVGNYWVAPGVGIVKTALSHSGATVETELVSTR